MSTEIERFEFPVTGQAIRTTDIDGEPCLLAADICAALAHSNPAQAVADNVDPEDVRRATLSIPEGSRMVERERAFVNESGLYALIFGSRLPAAKAFKRWVTAEVLPAIRRAGSYAVAPQTYPEALRELASTVEQRDSARAALAEAAPKADAWDVLASAKGDYSVREAANILNRDPAIETGQNRLFQKLRDLKLIDKNDIPYATHSRHVVLRPRSWRDPDGVEQADEQVRVTADGLRYLRKRLNASPVLFGLEAAA